MRDLALTLVVLGSLPFALVRPYIGVLVWYWLSFMSPHKQTWGFAQSLRVALISGAVTILAWLISREPKLPPRSPLIVLLGAFTLWVSVTTLFALQPDLAFEKWIQVIKILGFTYVTACLLNSRARIDVLIWVIVASIGFFALRAGVFTILTGGQWRVWGPPGGFIEDNNHFALALTMLLPLMRYLQHGQTRSLVRWGLWALIGLTLISILGTYSRGGFLALCVMVLFLWLRTRQKFLTGLLVFGTLAVALTLAPQRWYDRIATIQTYEEDQSANARLQSWTFALRVAAERPVVGGGFSIFYDEQRYLALVPEATSTHNAHSIYFEVLGEHGYVGLTLFLMLGASSLAVAQAIIRNTRRRPDLAWANSLAAMMQVALIGYAAAGAFLNLGFFDLFYAYIALLVGLRHVVKQELGKSAAAEAVPVASPQVRAPSPALASVRS